MKRMTLAAILFFSIVAGCCNPETKLTIYTATIYNEKGELHSTIKYESSSELKLRQGKDGQTLIVCSDKYSVYPGDYKILFVAPQGWLVTLE